MPPTTGSPSQQTLKTRDWPQPNDQGAGPCKPFVHARLQRCPRGPINFCRNIGKALRSLRVSGRHAVSLVPNFACGRILGNCCGNQWLGSQWTIFPRSSAHLPLSFQSLFPIHPHFFPISAPHIPPYISRNLERGVQLSIGRLIAEIEKHGQI